MRPSRDAWGLSLAALTAARATCLRRSVGCVLLNARGHVLATGYNGVAAGMPHCNQGAPAASVHCFPGGSIVTYDQVDYPHACSGARAASGTNLDGCQAIHAEQNALLQCRDVYSIETACVTASPCISCVKLLLNTSCRRIIFGEEYPHPASKELWMGAGREWLRLEI